MQKIIIFCQLIKIIAVSYTHLDVYKRQVLSRARVFVLNRLEDDALNELITRGEVAFDRGGAFDENARKALIAICDGDGRYILNLVGEILGLKSGAINADDVAKFAQRKPQAYDKNRDEHYNLISALHKSVRASDPDAALYWLSLIHI